jgi:hypothetical protein
MLPPAGSARALIAAARWATRLARHRPDPTDEQIRPSMTMVGGYAIAPAWGDGHHTGF